MEQILFDLNFYNFDGYYRLNLDGDKFGNKLDIDVKCFSESYKLYDIQTEIRFYQKHSEKVIMISSVLQSNYHCQEKDLKDVIVEIIENSKKIIRFFEGNDGK